MTLNKKKMVREIGRRTRIRNRDVQAVIEALIDVWTEELVSGGRIEIENFIVLCTRVNGVDTEVHSLGLCVRLGAKLDKQLHQTARQLFG